MKVLILTKNQDITCGNGRTAHNIAKKLIETGINVKVLVAQESGFDNEVLALPKTNNIIEALISLPVIRKYIKESDVVHSLDGFPYPVYAYLAGLGLRNKKYFANGVGTYSVRPFISSTWKAWLLKLAYRKLDKIFCISTYTAERIKYYMPDLKNTVIVYSGIDDSILHAPIKEKQKNHQPVIVSVGAIKARKGQLYSVKAIKQLKNKYPGIKLNIVGSKDSPNYFEAIKLYRQDHDLKENIEFFHNISDSEMSDKYQEADMFLMPSVSQDENFEGFGLVYVEAQSFGTPAIGTYNSGAEDAIKHKVSGYLVQQRNVGQIAQAIEYIFANPNYSEMSRKAGEFARHFTWDNTVKQFLKYYAL